MHFIPAGSLNWRRAAASALALAAGSASLFSPLPRAHAASDEPEGYGTDAFADVYREPAADLLLDEKARRKADALAEFVQGFLAESNSDSDEALAHYRRALALDPAYSALAIKVAYDLAQRGEVSEGISLIKDAIHESPREAEPYIHLAQIYARYLKKTDVAIRYASQALALAPDDFQSYQALYELQIADGNEKKAREILAQAAKSKSEDPQFWQQLGELLARLSLKGDGEAAPNEIAKMNTVFERALELADDDDSGLFARVADYFILSRQVARAVPLYEKVVALEARSGDEALLANTRDKLGRALFVTGEQEKAIAVLEALVKDSPLRVESYEMLGQLHEAREAPAKALANFQKSLLLDPNKPINYLRVSDLQMKLKQNDKAVETLEEAEKRFSDLPQITYSLAVTLGQAKRHAEAMTKFEEALLEARQSDASMLNSAFYFSYGAVAEQAGLVDRAVDLFHKSIELDPENAAQARNYLGFMWVDRGIRLDEAGKLIEQAVAAEPDNGAFLDSLGWYHYKKGDYAAALTDLKRAAELIPEGDAVVFDHIGDAYAKTGDTAQALIFWQKALALDPEEKKFAQKIEDAKEKVTALPSPANPE